jgi:hypothetical protein
LINETNGVRSPIAVREVVVHHGQPVTQVSAEPSTELTPNPPTEAEPVRDGLDRGRRIAGEEEIQVHPDVLDLDVMAVDIVADDPCVWPMCVV